MASSSRNVQTVPSARPTTARSVVGRWRDPSVAIAVTGATVGVVSFLAPSLLHLRPNRVVEGVGLSGLEVTGLGLGLLILALWVASGLLSFGPRSGAMRVGRSGLAILIGGLTLWSAGSIAVAFDAEVATVAARTSLSAGFYIGAFGLFLVQYAALADGSSRTEIAVVTSGYAVVIAGLALSGALANLGIVKEYQLAADTFGEAVRVHAAYALGVTGSAVAIGVPLGLWSARSRSAESAIVGALSFGQVFPGLAFVGLMMPVLSTASQSFPALRTIGVAGIGWAPVFIVLLVYALYPVTRNTLTAIRQLDPAVLDAAKGMGLTGTRRFFEVELPLALPVIIAGVRVALVQGTAGAVLAAFVGGGGLGTVMFLGLEQTSMDLVLVGVVPIVAMALSFDVVLRSVERAASQGAQRGVES